MHINSGGATHAKVANGALLKGFGPASETENVSVDPQAFKI